MQGRWRKKCRAQGQCMGRGWRRGLHGRGSAAGGAGRRGPRGCVGSGAARGVECNLGGMARGQQQQRESERCCTHGAVRAGLRLGGRRWLRWKPAPAPAGCGARCACPAGVSPARGRQLLCCMAFARCCNRCYAGADLARPRRCTVRRRQWPQLLQLHCCGGKALPAVE